MALKRFDIVRPDDLLNLQVELRNLQLDPGAPEGPTLVAEDPAQDAYLIVVFPPQTIAEEAMFAASGLLPPPAERDCPYNKDSNNTSAQMPARARARLGGPTRLVFRLPANSSPRIPYTIAGLLSWTGLELSVSALAGVPAEPTDDQRHNAPRIAPPGEVETAIELPYRLVLSPNSRVAWQHAAAPVTHAGRTELWHTRLAHLFEDGRVVEITKAEPAPLRAIWSPDYVAKPSQPQPSWPVLGTADRWAGLDVLTAMNPRDRHELVILTSAFSGFVKNKDDWATYAPKPIFAEQMILSPLGGWLKSRGNWEPPVEWLFPEPVFGHHIQPLPFDLIQPPPPLIPPGGPEVQFAQDLDQALLENIFAEFNPALHEGPILDLPIWLGQTGEPLNVSEWVHVATQGRDHYVRIVYEGYLYPFGHRASLVKVTERKFREVAGVPYASLEQRMFIVVREFLKDYNPELDKKAEKGRNAPLKQVRMLTRVTPNINQPVAIPGTQYSFWVRVNGQEFPFHALGQDGAAGAPHPVDATGALIFVPNSDANPGALQAVRNEYRQNDPRRVLSVPGQPLTYAERAAGGPDNTTLTTQSLYFDTVAGVKSPFLPVLDKAAVSLTEVEQILGSKVPTEIQYYPSYVAAGFDAGNEVFAQLVTKAQPKFSAEKGGGIATPDLSISGLTRKLGAVAGSLDKAASDQFEPADFFADVAKSATLFGKLELVKLILPGGYSKAPTIQRLPDALPPQVRLSWEPEIDDLDAGFLKFNKGAAASLKIEGVIEQPVDGSPGRSHFTGRLADFSLEFITIIRLNFESFEFISETDKKTDVIVKLRPGDDALQFLGDLQFVNELKKIIPPALFGDGPSLELIPQPPAIRAGFSIGLPPVAVGVFALKDVSLAAFLTLPFLNGSPLFDFNVSERARPFNLTVAFFGGGGFFRLQVDTLAVRIVEAAFEFGASASVNLGVASGGVHMMAGIYFKLETQAGGGKKATLTGYFRMGGELSVLGLISISLEFCLSFTYESGGQDAAGNDIPGKATGRATLTVKVEVLFFSTSVEITLEKKFGGQNGDPVFAEVWDGPGVWSQYAGAFA